MGFSCRLVGFAVVALTLSGCGGVAAPAKDPVELLRNYAQALRAGDADRAWAMLDDDAKQNTSLEAFRHWLQGNPADATRLADLLERPKGPVVTARVPLVDDDPIEFVEQDGAYRIRLSSLDRYSQLTPNLTLMAFVRAVKRRRYDVLLRLAPARDRNGLSEQRLADAFEGSDRARIAGLVRSIELALPSGRLDIRGNRATLDLGAGSRLTLLQEAGAWALEDYLP